MPLGSFMPLWAKRFLEKVNQNGPLFRRELGPCWQWMGATNRGYGAFQLGTSSKSHVVGAHKVAWTLYNGPVPDEMHVLHKCDNRACVKPDHLFLGTNSDNIADRVAKGRSVRATAKLTMKDVRSVRAWAAQGISNTEIASRLNSVVTVGQVARIVAGKRWCTCPL